MSFRLGFRRAGFYRLKVVRPVYSVSADDAAACDGTKAELVEGDVASTPTPATSPSDPAEHVDATSDDVPRPTTIPPRAAEAAQEAHADQVDVAHGR